MDRSPRWLMALLLQGLAVSAFAAEPAPMTAAQKAQAEQLAQETGAEGVAAFDEPTLEETGGDRGQGTINVAGQQLDIAKMVVGADKDTANADLEQASQGHNKDGLRTVSDRNQARLADDSDARGIMEIHDAKARETTEIRETLTSQINLTPIENAITGAENGVIGDGAAPTCTTTQQNIPRTSTRNVFEEKICERTNARTDLICSRELAITAVPVWIDGNERALLEVGGGQSGEICRRTVTVDEYRPLVAMDRVASLSPVTASGGLACTRNRWAEQVVEAVTRTRTADLPINGEIGGLSCQRERWAETSNGSTGGRFEANLNINGEQGGQVARRWIQPYSGTQTVSDEKTGTLSIDVQSPGLVCSRTAWPTSSTGTNAGSRNATLNIGNQTSRLECRRRIATATGTGTQSRSQNATLNVDTQSAGWQCTRAIGALTNNGSTSGSQAATLSVNNEQGGLSAQRWIYVTNGSGTSQTVSDASNYIGQGVVNEAIVLTRALTPPGGTASISNVEFVQTSFDYRCNQFAGIAGQPTAGNGWTVSYYVYREPPTGGGEMGCLPGSEQGYFRYTATSGSTKQYSVHESGNVSDPGTANCPTAWSCYVAAPTTINGIAVTAQEIWDTGITLFGGAPRQCTWAQLNRVCGGSSSTGNNISIAGSLPGGTTSISNFSFSVTNPQAGISVSLTSAPTQANGWTASFTVTRTNWSGTPSNPQIMMTWNVPTSTTSSWVWEGGDCAAAGTTNCPAQWSCEQNAPMDHAGATVTTTMAAYHAPLFPGASSSCARARRDRVCSGTANVDTSVSIAGNIPGGVTSIRNFRFGVANPQTGVSVALLTAPTMANGWTATFRVSRTIWSSQPNQAWITMWWDQDVPETNGSIAEDGSCSAASEPNCPVAWSCEAHAPWTSWEGHTVTTAMAASYAPLYPGAASTCANAVLNRTCSGTGTWDTSVSIAANLNGATSISGFNVAVTNPQAGVTVSTVQVPSAANSWVAILRVSRTTWTTTPSQPQVTLSWTGSVPTTAMSVQQAGDCNAGGTPQCPATWSCTQSAPATVNGQTVTPAMAAEVAPIFPGASSSCVVGELRRTCSGTANTSSQLSIADRIPGGVTAISNFAFTVQNPQTGVAVSLVSAPTQANGWVATFNVSRTDYATQQAGPQVRMTWQMDVPATQATLQTTGNPDDAGTAQCPAEWRCDVTAPNQVAGLTVTPELVTQYGPVYPGAPAACSDASKNKTCSGSASNITDVSIAGELPGGTTTINGFNWSVMNPQTGVTVSLVSAPTAGNGWVARFQTIRTDWAVVPNQPRVELTWNVPTTEIVLSMRESGNCADAGSPSCPTAWSCTRTTPATVNGIYVTEDMVAGQTPLFPATGVQCLNADLRRTCTGSATVGATITVSDLIPPGATSIRNFTHTVLNPQPGVAVNLIAPPTQANGWVATFDVVRTVWNTLPAQPQVRVDFEVDQISIALSVRETGDCADPGSQACPTEWSCAQSAPATINGQNVTVAMVQGEPLLYPGASNTCIVGHLNRVCSGQGDQATNISIADQLPPGTTEIFNFTWTQTNGPLPGTTVTLLSPPTEANGWVASFNVATNFALAGEGQVAPEVRLQWQIYGDTQYEIGEVTTGDCNSGDGGGPSCSEEWVCDRFAQNPRHRDPLDLWWRNNPRQVIDPEPWDPVCLEGRFVRTCSGDGATITEVSIAHHIPEGKTIRNYRWSVSQPIAGVTVTSLQDPAVENTWVARFQTSRQDWTSTPSGKPEVLLEWEVEGTSQNAITVVESGDCGREGDNFCKAEWVCREHADENAGFVSTQKSTRRSLATPAPGVESTSHQVDLSGNIENFPIEGFAAELILGDGFTLVVTDPPTEANGWKVSLEIRPEGELPSSYRTVMVEFRWTEKIPKEGATGEISPGDLAGRQPLYEGAPLSCIRAEKVFNCSNTNEGEICHVLDDGDPLTEDEQWCETVTEGANTCAELEQDQTCTLDRTICADGAEAADGFCYVENPVYSCRREVEVTDVVVRETTTCSGDMAPVCNGTSCEMTSEETTEDQSLAKAMAGFVITDTIMSDWVDTRPPAAGGPVPPRDGGDGWWVIKRNSEGTAGAPVAKSAPEAKSASVGAKNDPDPPPTTPPGGFDPFSMPAGFDPGGLMTEEDHEAAANGYYASGLNTNSFRLFAGKSMNCTRALGGLLNCCTKQPPPSAEPEKAFWEILTQQMRERWTGTEACASTGLDPNDPALQGAWSQISNSPGNAALNTGFTTSFESLLGGGQLPQCRSHQEARQEAATAEYLKQMRPKLSWYCDRDEKDLGALKKVGNCRFLGTWCQSRFLGACLDRRERYCCFNSPMSRMMREMLAKQGIGQMGTAKSPRCEGITVEQLAALGGGDGIDTDEIEGRITESGLSQELLALTGDALMNRLTGEGNNINNEGRIESSQRTLNLINQMDPSGQLPAQGLELTGTITGSPDMAKTAGSVTLRPSAVRLERGLRGLDLILRRDGGLGAVQVDVVLVDQTALVGRDVTFSNGAGNRRTVSWGDNQTGERRVKILGTTTVAPNPPISERRVIRVELQNATGGLKPTVEFIEIDIEPEKRT